MGPATSAETPYEIHIHESLYCQLIGERSIVKYLMLISGDSYLEHCTQLPDPWSLSPHAVKKVKIKIP